MTTITVWAGEIRCGEPSEAGDAAGMAGPGPGDAPFWVAGTGGEGLWAGCAGDGDPHATSPSAAAASSGAARSPIRGCMAAQYPCRQLR